MKSIYTLFLGYCRLSLLWLMMLTVLPLRAQTIPVPVIQGQAVIVDVSDPQAPVRMAHASSTDFGVLHGVVLSFVSASGNLKSVNRIEGATRTWGLTATNDGGFVVLAENGTDLFIVKKNALNNFVWSYILKTNTTSEIYRGVNILPTPDGGYLVIALHSVVGNAGNTNITRLNSAGGVLWSRDLFTAEPFNPFGNSTSIGFMQAVASADGTYLLTGMRFRPQARPQPNAAAAAKIDANANLIWSRTYSEAVAFADQAGNPRLLGTFLVLGITDPTVSGALNGPTYPYYVQTDGTLVRLGRFTLNNRSRITTYGSGVQDYVTVEGYGSGGSDFRLTRFDAQDQVIWNKTVGGSLEDIPQAILATADGYLVGGTTTSTDGDIRGKQNNELSTWVVKLSNIPNPETPIIQPPNPFVLNVQAYDCNTGQMALAIAGGNGSRVEYRIVGNRDWAAGNLFTIPAHQRHGTTFTLEARQSGQIVTRGFTAACGPNTNPQPPTNPSGFYLRAPGYNCETGKLIALYSNGTGTVEYRIAGLRDWGSSEEFTVPTWQRIGTTFTIEARLSNGAMSTILFTTACNAGESPLPTPGIPQFPPTLFFVGAPLNCSTGQLTVNIGGSNGTPLSYRIPGLADWQSSAVFQVPTYQRNGTTFTIDIRQTNQQIQASATVNCRDSGPGVARIAALAEPGNQLLVTVLPNPVTGNELVVEVSGANGQAIDFALTDAGGRVVLNQRAIIGSARHRQTLIVDHLIEGVYLLRVSSDSKTKVVKVLKL